MDKEEWRPIKGYEGFYMVSNFGRVKSCREMKRKGVCKNIILRLGLNGKRYPIVQLSKNGVTKTPLVHKLVAEAFLGERPVGYEINHKDENKSNNCVSNLEYCTHLYNIRYGTGIVRSKEIRSILYGRRVVCYDLKRLRILKFNSESEAARKTGISLTCINMALKKKRYTAGGCFWEYL